MSNALRKLIAHLVWADKAVLDSLHASPGGDARSLTLYAHVVAAEAVWLARIAGRKTDVAVWPTLTLEEASSLARRNADELTQIIESATPDDFGRDIEYRNSAGAQYRSTVEDILLHVALHGSYHRGQISLIVRGGEGEPSPTDYIAFIRGAPAARTLPPVPLVQPK